MKDLKKDVIHFLKKKTEKDLFVSAKPEDLAYFFPKKDRSSDVFQDLRQTISQILPQIALTEHIPEDSYAKKISRSWENNWMQASVLIVSFENQKSSVDFLKNLSEAINQLLVPATWIDGTSIEKEKKWELILESSSLKFMILPPLEIWKKTSLIKWYRENSHTEKSFLNNVPIFLMNNISSYLKNPQEKRLLWNTLNSLLSTSTLL